MSPKTQTIKTRPRNAFCHAISDQEHIAASSKRIVGNQGNPGKLLKGLLMEEAPKRANDLSNMGLQIVILVSYTVAPCCTCVKRMRPTVNGGFGN